MKTSSFHLNLLKPSEKLSSSPVRIRVMLPVGTMLACIGMLIWWAVILGQSFILKNQTTDIENDIKAKTPAHSAIMKKMELVRELNLQLEQLGYYKTSIRRLGEPLASLADIIPLRVQLSTLTISELPPQSLKPPGGRGPALLGPLENCETQKVVIAGLTTKETPVVSMMESLDSPEFENLLTNDKKINSFRQTDIENDGRRLLSFEVEYSMPERRFAK